MKIRNPRLIRTAGWLATQAVRALVRTQRFESLGSEFTPQRQPPGRTPRHIYSIWHENLLLPTVKYGCDELAVLISKHADGQLLGSLIEAMGMSQVQGSTNRGGIEAVRKLIHDPDARRHLAVTPDGPRGPRRIVQPGIVYVASRTGMTIVCTGVGYERPFRAGSWDRFAIPRPGMRAKMLLSPPIHVPPGLKTEALEHYRQMVQAEMDRVNAAAELWAMTNRKPILAAPIRRAA
jgi:lysophospholipid acyltransferase (LPLAT)-like uncharacterized protein